ncbi:arginine utilization regulatory protein [Desulfocicer vacuolatum DSM 3385]|uniref:Arginine utilization regulatory protein n=1 Tax=Desulfocicer vacuolatum DSM 3385 TaxID=1121400 RepID=A0A1W2AUP2_9BACT|nr:sigma 54-interacting transcriptional regulator [Desulfocicer vacuolatum]SMC63908.1 arginine utilization regulatory protein [Desulfocicer vacuolatum DSM 3385]
MPDKELNMDTVLSPAYCEIWDNSLLGVMVLDKNGIFRYMNRLFLLTDDLQDEDALGKSMVDFYPLERDCHMSIMAMETEKPILKKTVVYYTHKKKLVNSLCSTFPLMSRGQVEGVIHFSLNLQVSQRLMERHENGSAQMVPSPIPREKKQYRFDSIIGEDSQLKHAINYAKSASNTDFSVFIWAESGCGKELFAQSIHTASHRKENPFVAINCAAIPDNLLETTLFGTSKGAFTGALDRAGLLEEAKGGTLLLDELNSMSLELQAKLLRVIQERKIRRVGALKEIPVDVRFISTCNISPARALEENKIRADLFYRLGVVVLEIPPLRHRRDDIPLLCRHFLARWVARSKGSAIRISDAVYEILYKYPWPGNVRELEHTLKACLTLLHGSSIIYEHHLSSYFVNNYRRLTQGDGGTSSDARMINGQLLSPASKSTHNQAFPGPLAGFEDTGKICLSSTLKSIETIYIEKALKRAGYNISKAGRFLNLSPQALRYRIKKLGIHVAVE